VLFAAVIYALCAISRLARFNVETEDETAESHMTFAGLPSPPAAGLVVSVILFHEEFVPIILVRYKYIGAVAAQFLDNFSLNILPFVLMFAGIMMVSRVPYPHLANSVFKKERSFIMLVPAIAVVALAIWSFHIALFVGFFAFALYGVVRYIVLRVHGKITDTDEDDAQDI